jgi:outer membrane protein OmpU
MKKALYGTTALMTAGLVGTQADAASGLKLGITGYYRGAAGAIIGGESFATPGEGQGDFGKTNGGFRQDIRITFTGEATLDNGVTVGALVQLFGENTVAVPGSFISTTPIYRSHIDFKGKFGDFRFGEDSGVLGNVCVSDPGNVTANFGVNSPAESFSNAGRGIHNFLTANGPLAPNTIGVAPVGSVGTCEGIEHRGTKISYYTPAFGGFQFGISYSPSGNARNPGGGYFYGSDLRNRSTMNVISAGGGFNGSLGGGFNLSAGAAGEWALEGYSALGTSQADQPAAYTLGFQFGLPGGFAVGASGAYYQHYFHGYFSGATDAFGSDNSWVTTAGASYHIDAVSVGLQGMYSRWNVYGNAAHDNVYGVSLNGTYALGPGIALEGQVAYTRYGANDLFAPGPVTIAGVPFTQPISYDAVEIDAGFAVNF